MEHAVDEIGARLRRPAAAREEVHGAAPGLPAAVVGEGRGEGAASRGSGPGGRGCGCRGLDRHCSSDGDRRGRGDVGALA